MGSSLLGPSMVYTDNKFHNGVLMVGNRIHTKIDDNVNKEIYVVIIIKKRQLLSVLPINEVEVSLQTKNVSTNAQQLKEKSLAQC